MNMNLFLPSNSRKIKPGKACPIPEAHFLLGGNTDSAWTETGNKQFCWWETGKWGHRSSLSSRKRRRSKPGTQQHLAAYMALPGTRQGTRLRPNCCPWKLNMVITQGRKSTTYGMQNAGGCARQPHWVSAVGTSGYPIAFWQLVVNS